MTLLSYPKLDDYGQTPPPSALKTAVLSAFKPFAESTYFFNKASNWAFGTPIDEEMKASIELINYQLSNPDMTGSQRVGNVAAQVAGTLLDPITLGFASAGAKAVGGVAKAGLDIFPDIVGGLTNQVVSKEGIQTMIDAEVPIFKQNKWAKYLPKSYGEALERGAESAGAFAGFDVPTAFSENYNADQKRLDYGGMAKSVAINGGIGLAFPPIMWAMGLISGKLDKVTEEVVGTAVKAGENVTVRAGKFPSKVEVADKALQEGVITPEEHEFYTKFHMEPADVDGHLQRARRILAQHDHPVNALTGNIEMQFLTAEEMSQLQGFAADQMASSVSPEYKEALTTMVSHNALDRMTEMLQKNPAMMDGMRGHLDSIVERLEKKVESLEKGDQMIEKTMPRREERLQPIDQKKLMRMMERGNLTEKEMPFVIPKNLRGMRRRLGEIKKSEMQYGNAKREFEKTGKMKFKKRADHYEKRIKEKRADFDEYVKKNEIKTQAKELDEIEQKLLGGDNLPDNYHSSDEYLRLRDLAHFSSRARRLVKRVNLREQYEQQEALHDVMRGIMKIAESGMQKVSDPEKAVNYLKERIETNLDIPATYKDIDEKVGNIEAQANEPLASKQESIDTQINSINENPDVSKETKQELNTMQEKLKQFEGGDKARAELVNCIMEAENVRI